MFCYYLADKHHKSVAQLLREYDSVELADWMVYLNQDHYRKVIAEKAMTADQRTTLLKSLFSKARKNDKHR